MQALPYLDATFDTGDIRRTCDPTSTPERWQAVPTRAHEAGITVRQLAGSGAWIATSGTDHSIAYEVTPWQCEYSAGAFGDPICKHRAALRGCLGWLTVADRAWLPIP